VEDISLDIDDMDAEGELPFGVTQKMESTFKAFAIV
jgi:hypothetical protein